MCMTDEEVSNKAVAVCENMIIVTDSGKWFKPGKIGNEA